MNKLLVCCLTLGLWLGNLSAQQRNIPLDQLKSGLEYSSPEQQQKLRLLPWRGQ